MGRKPLKKSSRRSRKVKKSVRKSRKVKKSVRRSRKVNKSMRKSRKVNKSMRKYRFAEEEGEKDVKKSPSRISQTTPLPSSPVTRISYKIFVTTAYVNIQENGKEINLPTNTIIFGHEYGSQSQKITLKPSYYITPEMVIKEDFYKDKERIIEFDKRNTTEISLNKHNENQLNMRIKNKDYVCQWK